VFAVDDEYGGKLRTPPDLALAEVAARQFGVVARRQLLELGLSHRAIDRRLTAGRLHPLHRAVYAVGHRVVER
jgi:Transcriptional regulator, AbiEi antitoxin